MYSGAKADCRPRGDSGMDGLRTYPYANWRPMKLAEIGKPRTVPEAGKLYHRRGESRYADHQQPAMGIAEEARSAQATTTCWARRMRKLWSADTKTCSIRRPINWPPYPVIFRTKMLPPVNWQNGQCQQTSAKVPVRIPCLVTSNSKNESAT